MPHKVAGYYHYTGAIHMHTTESDGTLPLHEVIKIGQHTGLDFMMFTDHMNMVNRDNGGEGIYGDTLVVIGYEHNDLDDKHHYLIFDSPKVYPEDWTPKQYVKQAHLDGALGIMAHPDEQRPEDGPYPPYEWNDWDVEGYDGIELWNQMSEWMEKLTRWNKLIMAFSPRKSMIGPTERLLKKWDEVNLQRKVVGIVGVDAHAFPVKVWPFTVQIFPYKTHFRCLRMHVLLPEKLSKIFDVAKQQLYDAIRDCRVFGSNMRWGAADKFEFTATGSGRTVVCGGELPLSDDVTLHARLPGRAALKLVHNGKGIVETDTRELEYRVQAPGIYRVEAWKGDRGWIFSNHIRIGL